MKRWLRDWWRGFTDDDFTRMIEKLASPQLRTPGSIMKVTRGELNAYRHWLKVHEELGI